MGIQEPGRPLDQRHAVAGELVTDHVGLPADHVPGPALQILDRDHVLHPIALAVDRSLVVAGQVQDGLAEGLGRDGPGDDAHAAELPALHDRGSAPQLGRLDRGLLPGGPRSDDDQVVVVAPGVPRVLLHAPPPDRRSGLLGPERIIHQPAPSRSGCRAVFSDPYKTPCGALPPGPSGARSRPGYGSAAREEGAVGRVAVARRVGTVDPRSVRQSGVRWDLGAGGRHPLLGGGGRHGG
jgi:hypothetical protein